MRFRTLIAIATAVVSALASTSSRAAAQSHDMVLAGGRVMDPESGLDAVRHVEIRNGTITAISESPLDGETVVDVSGLVVAPGFIDLHAHGQDLFSSRLQARDGVTAALELESGTGDVEEWYASREGRAVIHYGATASHGAARRLALGGREEAVRLAADLAQIAGDGGPAARGAGTRGCSGLATASSTRLEPGARRFTGCSNSRLKKAWRTSFTSAVIDNATFESPTQPSSGIEHVLVAGSFVVRGAELVDTASPARPFAATDA